VGTIPADGAQLWIDSQPWESGATLALSPGSHDVRIVHHRFPILDKQVKFERDTIVTWDLVEEFDEVGMFGLAISTYPPLDEYNRLRVRFNGWPEDYGDGGKALGIIKRRGRWKVEFEIVERDGSLSAIAVDSFRLEPGAGGSTRIFLDKGSVVDFLVSGIEAGGNCRIVVFR
jgi:hypothetical protein